MTLTTHAHLAPNLGGIRAVPSFNTILPSKPDLPNGVFPSDFPTNTLPAPFLSLLLFTFPTSHSSLFGHPKLLILRSPPVPCYLVPLRLKCIPQHLVL